MLATYRVENNRVVRSEPRPGSPVPPHTIWMDLMNPTQAEVAAVERSLDLDVPTLDEMKEIEASSRLRVEDGVMLMTAMVLSQSETERPLCSAITFILSNGRLVTIRYADPQPFRAFSARIQTRTGAFRYGEHVLLGILDAIIDRTADILEFGPAMVTTIVIPLTFSITDGIGFGFIAYAAGKLLGGRGREVGVTVWAIAVAFAVFIAVA